MKLTWCKLHTDILGDAKLMRAARQGGRHLVILPWLFAWVRENDATDSGRLVVGDAPAEPEDIAALIPGVTPKQVRQCLESLLNIGVATLDTRGVIVLTSWDHRSGPNSGKPSDQPEAIRERVRRHRAQKQVAAAQAVTEDASDADHTDAARYTRDTVTPSNAGNALRNATDKRREEEEEEKRTTLLAASSRADTVPTEPTAIRPTEPGGGAVLAGTVVGDIAGAAVLFTAALNRGVTTTHGEQPVPVRHDGQLGAAEAILEAGVAPQWAADWLYHRASRSASDKLPRSLRYLSDACIAAWRAHLADADATRHAAAFLPGADPAPPPPATRNVFAPRESLADQARASALRAARRYTQRPA